MTWIRAHKAAVAVAVVAFLVGIGAGSGSTTTKTKTTTVSQTQTETTIKTVNAPADELASARAKLSRTRQRLADTRASVRNERDTLNQLQAQVSGTRAAIRRGTFGGTGTYLVGQDIDPGTYRAAASPGCYWERESSLSGGVDSIIANDNADGPVVVTIGPGDKAFKDNGCAKFHKIG